MVSTSSSTFLDYFLSVSQGQFQKLYVAPSTAVTSHLILPTLASLPFLKFTNMPSPGALLCVVLSSTRKCSTVHTFTSVML